MSRAEKVYYRRCMYQESLNYPGQMEIHVYQNNKKYVLSQVMAVVWSMVDGKRGIDEIYKNVYQIISRKLVEEAIKELLRVKLIEVTT